MINGFANLEETKRFFQRKDLKLDKVKEIPYFYISPLSISANFGENNLANTKLCQECIEFALTNGINHVDTSIHLSNQTSEQNIGYVLNKLIKENDTLNRSEIIISTKGGFIPSSTTHSPSEYAQEILIKDNILSEDDLVTISLNRVSILYSINDKFIEYSLNKSLENLNIETLDIFYIQNPEFALMALGKNLFYNNLETTFATLEKMVMENKIKYYGISTWNSFWLDNNNPSFLNLEEIVDIAKFVSKKNKHHFKFIQFPYNSTIMDAQTQTNQLIKEKKTNLFDSSKELNLYSITYHPLDGGKNILNSISAKERLKALIDNDNITSTVVGMKKLDHIKENIETFNEKSHI